MAVAQIKSNMKRKAKETQEKPIQIFTQELQSASVMSQRVKRQLPILQANLVEDLHIPEEYKYYGNNQHELFLLADSGEHMVDSDRVIIFGRERNLVWSEEVTNVFLDGTFSITPAPFNQVYAILAEKNAVNPAGGKYVFPILYALLKNKNRATYNKLFGMVKALMPRFNPSSINVDFEQSAIKALRETFPDALKSEDSKIAGCFFHLLKNFKKQLGEAGIMQKESLLGSRQKNSRSSEVVWPKKPNRIFTGISP